MPANNAESVNTPAAEPDIAAERRRLFVEKCGALIAQRRHLYRKDQEFLRGLERKISSSRHEYEPVGNEFGEVCRIAQYLKPSWVTEQEIKPLISTAEQIIRNGSLPSGRMFSLIRVVDTFSSEKTMTRNELNTLHFLVLEGTDYRDT